MRIWIKRIVWVLFFVGVLVLMFRSCDMHEKRVMEKPKIIIHVKGEDAFLTEDELYDRLKRKGYIFEGQTHKTLNITTSITNLFTWMKMELWCAHRVYTRLESLL
ncbi:MAG: hypothetical protein LW704_08465 [Cryomorphaceae bacterium]|nr:hypothetical protein [Cryomorphaceae bacterium]